MGAVKKPKTARPRRLKNRYCAGAKISEHKFLRILRGFADGLTIAELKPTTQVSGKTIRAIYRLLRERLVEAIMMEPDKFGGAGHILKHSDSDRLVDAVRRSSHYRRHKRRHAPRMKGEEEEQKLAVELIVRMLCAIDLRAVASVSSGERIALEDAMIAAVTQLRTREPFHRLAECIPGARPHAHGTARFYEDFRRVFLNHPLGT